MGARRAFEVRRVLSLAHQSMMLALIIILLDIDADAEHSSQNSRWR
jgi:hypothetical protein